MSPSPRASVPPLSLLTPFAVAFTAPTFRHVLVLVSGTILASGRRTVTAALRAVGLGEERRFTTYHRVLNRGVWSALVLSRLLLGLLVRTFLAAEFDGGERYRRRLEKIEAMEREGLNV